jgi:hypothetical protein
LWVVVVALVGWSAVMWIAERVGKRDRPEPSFNLKDAVIIGSVQCVALIPGVSRSGTTISARMLLDLDRVAATRLAFFLAIPALVAAGAYEAIKEASVIRTGSAACPLDRCCTYGLSPLHRCSGPARLDDSCGDGSDDTPRSKSGARRTTAMVALVGEDERAVLWQKLLTRASFSPTIRPRSSA